MESGWALYMVGKWMLCENEWGLGGFIMVGKWMLCENGWGLGGFIMVGNWMLCENGWGLVDVMWLRNGRSGKTDGV